jgi:hypothetical protein
LWLLPFQQGRGTGFAGPQAQRPPRGGRELHEVSDRGGYFCLKSREAEFMQ